MASSGSMHYIPCVLPDSFRAMHRSIAGHNPYNLFILTIVYSKNLPTN